MSRAKKITTLWSLGLAAGLEQQLGKLLGKNCRLANWPEDNIPPLSAYENDLPGALILTPASLGFLQAQPEQEVRHLELMPKVMLLKEGYSKDELEQTIDAGISEIIRPPYTEMEISAQIRRAREIETVQDDLLRMSKEIIVEREILERKNDILNFLVNFLTGTSVSMNPQEILQTVFGKLQMIFPVRNMQAALWDAEACSEYTNLYISTPEMSPSYNTWTAMLEEAVAEAMPKHRPAMDVTKLVFEEQDEKWKLAGPTDGHIVKLPISMDNKQIGILLVLTDMARGLSRDQALALNSAMHHLALTLKNARNYQIMKLHADFDGLTGLFNRRHFNQRIEEEIDRYQRYNQPVSLIFADIDHFKQINDSKGHRAGDAALQQVATIIMQTLRASDYAARYGGEEFVILLPHTSLKQAQKMAERLRGNIAKHNFHTEMGAIDLTISLGVADLENVAVKNAGTLIHEADSALYRAKRSGRNRTVVCMQPSAKVAV